MIKISVSNHSFFTLYKKKNSEIFKDAVAHPDLQICFVTRGDAVWQINGQLYPVEPGNIIFLNSNQKRRFVKYGEDGLSLSVIYLDRRVFTDSYHFSFFLHCIEELNGVFKKEELVPILAELYRELEEKKDNYCELASAKLTEFFVKAERLLEFKSGPLGKYDKKMVRILDFIDSRITGTISLAEAAQFAGFTESSFSRWFSRLNGVTFKKYVMSKKIDHAIMLLKTTDAKVVDIAYDCGFDSISGFYDTFKKITGTTPNKFSERHDI
ncbi:MAG: helix-turn-helix transcriptional regulator [Clostridia bacterium]|nr:helix-turn-helix transcriptional regulator [Clostridia bacterium]